LLFAELGFLAVCHRDGRAMKVDRCALRELHTVAGLLAVLFGGDTHPVLGRAPGVAFAELRLLAVRPSFGDAVVSLETAQPLLLARRRFAAPGCVRPADPFPEVAKSERGAVLRTEAIVLVRSLAVLAADSRAATVIAALERTMRGVSHLASSWRQDSHQASEPCEMTMSPGSSSKCRLAL
jgi:hypothetical protein